MMADVLPCLLVSPHPVDNVQPAFLWSPPQVSEMMLKKYLAEAQQHTFMTLVQVRARSTNDGRTHQATCLRADCSSCGTRAVFPSPISTYHVCAGTSLVLLFLESRCFRGLRLARCCGSTCMYTDVPGCTGGSSAGHICPFGGRPCNRLRALYCFVRIGCCSPTTSSEAGHCARSCR